jgi:hypothetical protein
VCDVLVDIQMFELGKQKKVYHTKKGMENIFNAAGFGKTTEVIKTAPAITLWLYGVAIIVFIAALLYWWFKPRAENVTALGPFVLKGTSVNPDEKSTLALFEQSQINSSMGNNFTFSFFVYMDDVNRERIPIAGPKGDFRFKTFIYILGVGDIILDPIHQMARFRLKPLTPEALARKDTTTDIDIENVMIARWNQITFTMEGRTVDIYLNGAHASSTLLENLPILNPVGILLESSPDFSGQAGLVQAWPRRLTSGQIADNYKRNTDTRGKPVIPDIAPKITDIFKHFPKTLCDIGLCGFQFSIGPIEYIDYEYA